MKYTLSRQFQEQKENQIIIKRHVCLSFFHLYLFIRSCKLVITETRAYDIAHDESTMSVTNCLSVFDHFVKKRVKKINLLKFSYTVCNVYIIFYYKIPWFCQDFKSENLCF